jgi:hypothetical protein
MMMMMVRFHMWVVKEECKKGKKKQLEDKG